MLVALNPGRWECHWVQRLTALPPREHPACPLSLQQQQQQQHMPLRLQPLPLLLTLPAQLVQVCLNPPSGSQGGRLERV